MYVIVGKIKKQSEDKYSKELHLLSHHHPQFLHILQAYKHEYSLVNPLAAITQPVGPSYHYYAPCPKDPRPTRDSTVRADTVMGEDRNAHPLESITASTRGKSLWCIA
jgi:hypothetical protein